MYALGVLRSWRKARMAWPALAFAVTACGTDEVVFPSGALAPQAKDAQAIPEVDAERGGATAPDQPPDAAATSEGGETFEPESREAGTAERLVDAQVDATVLGCSEQVNPPYAPACVAVPLTPARIAASAALVGQPPQNAFDGDVCTSWRAGANPPQWIEVELCTGARCAPLPRINRLGLYMDREPGTPFTVELQGATSAGRLTNAFHTMASASIVAAGGYAEMAVTAETQPVLRVLVNSGPPSPVVIREVVFLQCP